MRGYKREPKARVSQEYLLLCVYFNLDKRGGFYEKSKSTLILGNPSDRMDGGLGVLLCDKW
jgi:hypothetical protein